MSAELATRQAGHDEFVAFLERAAGIPDFPIEMLERMFALKERQDAQQRKALFHERLAQAQALMPPIKQNGVIDYGGKGKIAYAKLEDIDATIRPIYSPLGFSVTWNAPTSPDGKVRVVGDFSCCGHTEQREMTLPPDTGGGKNAVQAVPSAVSYGKRQITKMFWNLVEIGTDKDGAANADLEPISQQKADDIRIALESVNADMDRFKNHFGIRRLEDLRIGQLKEVDRQIEAKRKR